MDRPGGLSTTRRRDLRSAVKRVADLLGNEPGAIPLDLAVIGARLSTINPMAVGMTSKRFANVRSDFLAAMKASGLMAARAAPIRRLTAAWAQLFEHLSDRRAQIGLSRLARYASAEGIEPRDIDDRVIDQFIATVREGSLHRNPNTLHRQVTLIWNQVACDLKLGLNPVTIASFRGPPKRIVWSLLTQSFRRDVEDYLSWAERSDPFTPEARSRALAPKTLRLRRDQIHAAVSALVQTGIEPGTIFLLSDLVAPANFKKILQRRIEMAGNEDNSFNKDLGTVLVLIAREWVKVEGAVLAELKRLASKLPVPVIGLTTKNKAFLRQFEDPRVLIRLVKLPEKLWSEVKRDDRPTFHTLAKAQTALAIAILTYMPVRIQNLARLAFDTHLFVRAGAGAISTLELSSAEVKNQRELAFDIPPEIAKMLIEYRERIAPKIIGHRPTRLFVNAYGTPKGDRAIAYLISTYTKKRIGIVLTPHQFRHLSAKVMLDAQPGAFESVRQLLGHKRSATTVNAYAGIDSRRAAQHHRRLIENALAAQRPLPSSPRPGRS